MTTSVSAIFQQYSASSLCIAGLVGFFSFSVGMLFVHDMTQALKLSDLYLIKSFVCFDKNNKARLSRSAYFIAFLVYLLFFVLLVFSPVGLIVSASSFIFYAAVAGILAALVLSDFLVGFLPTLLLLLLASLTLVGRYYIDHIPLLELLHDAVLSGLILFTISAVYYLIRGVHGFGIGDSIFLFSCGAYVGVFWVFVIIGISSLLMFPYALFIIFSKKKNLPVPFMPALIVSFLLVFLYQPYLLQFFYWYVGIFQ